MVYQRIDKRPERDTSFGEGCLVEIDCVEAVWRVVFYKDSNIVFTVPIDWQDNQLTLCDKIIETAGPQLENFINARVMSPDCWWMMIRLRELKAVQ